ncbi:MAG: D-glycerate dehydrogenase [Chloroflexi bacterium]|nr:D-glycerate dehydrogenase [Chloroflexota bacterium]OJW04347.1 MAG: D-glycerate dehydrogenase [Chloroflexi bacterium 54-19]
MKAFVSRAIPPAGLQVLDTATGLEIDYNSHDAGLSKADLIARTGQSEGLLCLLTDTIDAEVLASCPNLKVISNMAVGYNNIDVAEATRRGILVTNTPGVLTDTTADLTWALLLAVARRIGEGERLVRAGEWHGWGPLQLLGGEVNGKTLGIIGMGRIGQAVARRALGFNMKVIYHNRSGLDPALESELKATRVGLDELIAKSDFVSLHAPYTKETHHLINAEKLARMQPTSYLINTARGPLVDEAALVAALKNNRIAGAALDVYEEEPVLYPGLRELDNAVLAPHLGSATHQTRGEMSRLAATNLVMALSGKRPLHPVNPDVLEKK